MLAYPDATETLVIPFRKVWLKDLRKKVEKKQVPGSYSDYEGATKNKFSTDLICIRDWIREKLNSLRQNFKDEIIELVTSKTENS